MMPEVEVISPNPEQTDILKEVLDQHKVIIQMNRDIIALMLNPIVSVGDYNETN